MKVVITTYGSRGDHQPFIALAKGFLRAGHEVRLGGAPVPAFAELAAAHGVPFVPLGPPMFDAQTFQDLLQALSQAKSQTQQNRILMEQFTVPRLQQMYEECRELASWGDVVISHTIQAAGRMAAETLRRPYVGVMLVPPHFPTQFNPPPGLPNLGAWSNRVLWRLVLPLGLAQRPVIEGINRVRQRAGLPALRNPAADGFAPPGMGFTPMRRHPLMALMLQPTLSSPELNLIPVSQHVAPLQPDAPRHHHLTGYWFLEREEWNPTPEVVEFMEGGPKPVAISFTTANEVAPELPETSEQLAAAREALAKLVIDAAAQAGVRAIVYQHWFSATTPLPDTMFCAGDIPHQWLFPRVAAVVHHGGAGTTAAALRAGAPAVVVPDVWDQLYWASVVAGHGAAPPPIPLRELSADRLAAAIKRAVEEPAMRERAARIGIPMSQEDGVSNAVRLVESHLGVSPRPVLAGEGRRH